MTAIEKACLELLAKGPLPTGTVGSELWQQRDRHRMPQHYARPAGKLLRRLERRGLVTWGENYRHWVWKLTVRGTVAARTGVEVPP